MHWRELTSVAQLGAVIEASNNSPVALFKHSTTCGISHAAKARMETNWSFTDDNLPIYYLDLHQHRDVSNEIARVLDVTHQSPQLIVVDKGKAVFHSSHHAIDPQKVPV